MGLGLKAIEHGYRVLFTTAAAMLTTLTKALGEGRFDDKLKVFTIPRLLIIDEIGYLPIDRQAATLFFQLISRRYERGPMILTSNQSFGSWGDVFGDRVIASAILDRILHHATTKGEVVWGRIESNGQLEVNGEGHGNPSKAFQAGTGIPGNGWYYWHYRDPNGEWQRIDGLRSEYRRQVERVNLQLVEDAKPDTA